MKITLVQIDLVMGARILLSLLREKGYDVKLLQLNIRYTDTLNRENLDAIYDYVEGSDVIELSFNTFYALTARQLAVFLKEKGIKHIVTGGNHATALPEEAIDYSDVVIKYEAEITLLRVLENLKNEKDLSGIKGVIYKHDGLIFDNEGAPDIIWELDNLPFQCVDTDIIKYFDLQKKLYTPEKKRLFPHDRNSYFILASRGCPFECTYCCNSLYHSIDKRFGRIRKRSIDNILDEMKGALAHGFESFYIADDNFFPFSLKDIERFSEEYRKKIKKPFSVIGVNPNNFRADSSEQKLKLLLDCGLSDMRIGVQSGSNKTLEIFKRGYKAEDVPKLLTVVDRNRDTIWDPPFDKLHIALDFICDAEWEGKEDKMATIKLAQKALKQYSAFFYTLVYLPGTPLYALARKNGWVGDEVDDIYLKGIAGIDDNIYNRVLFLIAVMKERGIDISEKFIEHILGLADTNHGLSLHVIKSVFDCIDGTETHHKVNLRHAALHPYLTGFTEWTKTVGKKGRKVLFRSYHKPYG